MLIVALRFERRKNTNKKMFAKTYLRKIGAPMTNTTTEKLGAKRSLTYQRLHLSIPTSTMCLMAGHNENSRYSCV